MRALLLIALLLAISAILPAQADYARALREADQQLAAGDFQKIIVTLRDWPARLPDRPEANHYLGLAFYRLADYSAAIYHLSAALKHEAENSEPWKQTVEILGAAHYFKNNWQQAAPLLEKAASWQPANTDLQYTLAMSYLLTSNINGARKAFAGVYAVDPDSPQGYILTVDIMRKENVEAGVEQLLLEARNKWPTFPGIAFRLGTVAINKGEHEHAVALFREELKDNPSDSAAWHTWANRLWRSANPLTLPRRSSARSGLMRARPYRTFRSRSSTWTPARISSRKTLLRKRSRAARKITKQTFCWGACITRPTAPISQRSN